MYISLYFGYVLEFVLWQIQAGDPTLLGFMTAIAYLFAAALCTTCLLYLDRIFPNEPLLVHQLIWTGLALAMIFMGANKQLDLQTRLIATVKGIAYRQGWYEWGQLAQIGLVIVFGVISIIVVIAIGWSVRRVWKQYWILLFGLVVLARFVLVRIASISGVPLPELSQWTGGIRINWTLEVIGALLVASAALFNLVGSRSKKDLYQINY